MNGLLSDIQWSVRLMRRHPVFALTIVLTLGLAIGSVVTAYGVGTSVLWRPLPFAGAERLVFVWENGGTGAAVEPSRVTGFRFAEWERSATGFESMALFGSAGFLADVGSGATILNGIRVSTNYFDTLGISPLLGREFVASDGEPGAPGVVILSHALWNEAFGAQRSVIGHEVRLGGRPFTIVGVMPPVVFPAWPVNPAIVTLDPESRRLWVPIARTPQLATSARAHVFGVVARLKARVSADDAAGELTRMADGTDPDPHRAIVRPFRDQFVRDARGPLLALLAAAIAVLLVASTNLAALQGSSIESRRAELSVRAALGAGRRRLACQVATEAALLAGAGGLLGLVVSRAALVQIPRLVPPSVPLLTAPDVDLRTFLVAALVSLLAGGALAAWPLARMGTSLTLPSRGDPSISRSRVFRSLVIAQVALAMALVAVAALLQQSLNTVRARDAGFVIDRVLVGNLTLAGPAYARPEQVVAAERRLGSSLAEMPGARAVAFAYDHPLEANWIDAFTIVGAAGSSQDLPRSAQLRIVSPGYFEAMGVAVTEGRVPSEQDGLDAPGVVVVNGALARTMIDGPVLNRILRSSTPRLNWSNDVRLPAEFRIIGVVEDERFNGLEQPSAPAVYMSTRQFPQQQLAMLIRTHVDPAAMAADARRTVREFDAGLPVANLSTLSAILADQLTTRRATTQVIDGFAACALTLAGLGLYGLLALLVAARTRETGIRLALGSSPALEARSVLRECLLATGAGIACGVGLALVSGRLVQALLVGVSGRDAATLAVVTVTMLLVAVVASSLPAWRAARVDPAAVLRGEL